MPKGAPRSILPVKFTPYIRNFAKTVACMIMMMESWQRSVLFRKKPDAQAMRTTWLVNRKSIVRALLTLSSVKITYKVRCKYARPSLSLCSFFLLARAAPLSDYWRWVGIVRSDDLKCFRHNLTLFSRSHTLNIVGYLSNHIKHSRNSWDREVCNII